MRDWVRTLIIAAIVAPTPLLGEHVWVEGESGKAENVNPHGWYRSVRAQDLSGGDWLANFGSKGPAFASYEVTVPVAGRYTLWSRANPIGALLHVRIGGDEGLWLRVPITEEKHDVLNIASDGKPDLRFLAWAKVGPVSLRAGKTTLRFRMSSSNRNHGGLDCFCLTTDANWRPSKALKPGDSKDWPAPKLTDGNLRKWGDFIRPSEEDLAWRGVRWHRHLDEAAEEARQLGRPILLWAMNGHPCGET
ncbi:MAG: hypothetical protein VCA35_11535 [Roseibacillus sp.]